MAQYQDWQEDDNIHDSIFPIDNYYVTLIPPQSNFTPTKNTQPINQVATDEYNRNNYPQYFYQNKQQYNYSNQYYNQGQGNNFNSYYQDPNIYDDSLRKYESSDGVLRGYTNNYSFYVSGSSKVRPKVTINQVNYNNNYQNNRQFFYNNTEKNQQNQNIIYLNSNQNNIKDNYINRYENQNNNGYYIIKTEEKDPIIYGQANNKINNDNYNNYNVIYNNIDDENNQIYYYNNNEMNNKNIQQGKYQGPIIQRRIVKRVIDKEPLDSRKNYYIISPNENKRNLSSQTYQNKNKLIQQKPIQQNINNINNIYSKNFNNYQNNNNIDLKSFPLKRTNTPNEPKKYLNINNNAYLPKQQQIMQNSPNFARKNSYNNIAFQNKEFYYSPYYTEQNNYILNKTNNNYPRYNSPYIINSSDMNNERNGFIYSKRREREYNSRTELPNQPGYEFIEDEVYEVPEQYNNQGIYGDKRINYHNNNLEGPFIRLNNFSQRERNGKKYGAYTETLAMNRINNYNDEYEIEMNNRNIKNNNYKKNSSVPSRIKPINYAQKLVRKNRSFRNIRNNEEEFDLENEERNNRVQIKTTGSNNHRLFISNNTRENPERKYKTFTELQYYRPDEYILQDIEDNSFEVLNNNNVLKNYGERIMPQETGNGYRLNNLISNNNEEMDNEEMENNDVEESLYDSNQLMSAREEDLKKLNNEEKENEIEETGQEEMVNQKTNSKINIDEDPYQGEEFPKDRDELIPGGNKNLKNIQTEINEKYYDNQGNYLGEKNIITTKQIPIINQQEEKEYLEDQEEQEQEQEEIEENEDNEYQPYQSNNKKFKKRGENNKESKYHSYFGDSNNNVYYEIKEDVKQGSESKNEEESGNKHYKDSLIQTKNITFDIQSENMCVQGKQDNYDSVEKDNLTENEKNDEKEADEQQIEENSEIYDEDDVGQNIVREKNENLEISNKQEVNILNQNDNNKQSQIDKNTEIVEKEINEKENNVINNEEDENNKINEKVEDNNLDEIIDNNNSNIKSENENNNFKETINNNIEVNNENNNDFEKNQEINNSNEKIEDKYIEQNFENGNDKNGINDNNKIKDINNEENNENSNEENNENYNEENNINEYNNDNINNNNFEYIEEEQTGEENEVEELEMQNIQKDEGEEENIEDGMIDFEENKNYNYVENDIQNEEQGEEEYDKNEKLEN